jgi:predicted secreted protein
MAILGRELVIARDAGSSTFAAACITEQRSLEINNEEVDITKPDCAAPGGKLARQLMYGVQALNVSGQGAFVDTVTMQAMVADAVGQLVKAYQVTVPEVGTFEGDGLISITFSGDKTGELQGDIKLSLTGAIVFTAAA